MYPKDHTTGDEDDEDYVQSAPSKKFMSEMADYTLEQDLNWSCSYGYTSDNLHKTPIPKGYWKTGNKLIKLADMDKKHLTNAINWCIRHGKAELFSRVVGEYGRRKLQALQPKNHFMNKQQEVYISQNGKITKVSEMADEHLKNAINFCRRKGLHVTYNMLRRERYRRTGKS